MRPTLRSPRLRRVAGVAACATVAAAMLAGCVSRGADAGPDEAPDAVPVAELTDVTLNIGDQKGGTESLLRAAGELDDTPYAVAFSTFTSGPPQVEAATAGQIDFAVTGNTPPVFGAAANARIKVVTAYSNTATGDQVLVPADSPLTSVADLRGKKIAVGKGSSAHGHILLQLEANGLTPEDVELVFLQPADALTAFQGGQVDAWAIWDPYTAIAQTDSGARTLVTAEGVANGYGFGIAADTALADARKNSALEDFAVRLARASQWAQQNPQEWAAEYSAAVGIDPVAGELAQGRSLRPAISLDDDVIASQQQLYDVFVESGQIQDGQPFADFVDPRYEGALTEYTSVAAN